MIEYLETVIKKHPEQEFVARDGEGVHIMTGDPWFDQMQSRIVKGEEVTFKDLGVPEEEIVKLKKQAERFKAANTPAEKPAEKPTDPPVAIEEIDDVYHA